jgi:hypothetical protein
MRRRVMTTAGVIAISVLAGTAQEKPAPQAAQEKPAAAQTAQKPGEIAQLKVTVVIARYQGDKRLTNLPYTFGVSANSNRTTLRMGSDVPVFSRAQKTAAGEAPPPSFTYRPVGTNIDCRADLASPGLYSLLLIIEESSVELPSRKPGSTAVLDDIPSFRSVKASFTTILRDGQTTQHTSATDPVTGEVTKIDLTLNVIK